MIGIEKLTPKLLYPGKRYSKLIICYSFLIRTVNGNLQQCSIFSNGKTVNLSRFQAFQLVTCWNVFSIITPFKCYKIVFKWQNWNTKHYLIIVWLHSVVSVALKCHPNCYSLLHEFRIELNWRNELVMSTSPLEETWKFSGAHDTIASTVHQVWGSFV